MQMSLILSTAKKYTAGSINNEIFMRKQSADVGTGWTASEPILSPN